MNETDEAQKIQDWLWRLDRIEEHVKLRLAGVYLMVSVELPDDMDDGDDDPHTPTKYDEEWASFPDGIPLRCFSTFKSCFSVTKKEVIPFGPIDDDTYVMKRVGQWIYLADSCDSLATPVLNWKTFVLEDPNHGEDPEARYPYPEGRWGLVHWKTWYHYGLTGPIDAPHEEIEELERFRRNYGAVRRDVPRRVLDKVGPIDQFDSWVDLLLYLALKGTYGLHAQGCLLETGPIPKWKRQSVERQEDGFSNLQQEEWEEPDGENDDLECRSACDEFRDTWRSYNDGVIRFLPRRLSDAVHCACDVLRAAADGHAESPRDNGEHEGQEGADGESKNTALEDGTSKTNGRRGRKPMSPGHIAKDEKLARDWEAAKRQGNCRKDFARENDITLEELKKILNRVAKRKKRADK